jgi:PAS domain S-box-containing protein
MTCAPYRDKSGKVVGGVAIVQDISERKQAEELLKIERDKLFFQAKLLKSVGDAVVATHLDGSIIYWNDSAEHLYGWKWNEVEGKCIVDVLATNSSKEPGLAVMNVLEASGDWCGEIEVRHRDGHQFKARVTNTAIYDEFNQPSVIISISSDLTEQRKLEMALVSNSEELKQIVGQELHDHLGQQLAAINYTAQSLATKSAGQNLEDVASIANLIATQTQEAVALCKQLAQGLLPFELETGGLQFALSHFAERISNTYRIRCEFICSLENVPDDQNLSLNLYRIAQEATNNALKHASASLIEISLLMDDDQYRLAIQDNGSGIGIDNERRKANRGMGIKLMQYRAHQIGATIKFISREKGGTEILVERNSPL